MTIQEQVKLEALRTRFNIDVREPTDVFLANVTLSECWKFAAVTLDEALDQCLSCILKNVYKDNADVKKDYDEGLKKLQNSDGEN